MNFIRLYARVLKLLGDESRLGWMLAIANVSLAAAQFAEPVLFGRIVDTLNSLDQNPDAIRNATRSPAE